MATGATHIMRAHPAARRSAPSASGCGCAGLPRTPPGPGRSKGSRVPPPESTTGGPGSGSSKVLEPITSPVSILRS